MDRVCQTRVLGTVAFLLLTAHASGWANAINEPSIADAGQPRYAAADPVRLDGSGSYDPDHSGPLTYAWTQISGSPLVIIVPEFGPATLQQQNPPFDPNKPTVFYFSGGDCVTGFANEQAWGNPAWLEKANIVNFPAGYAPDNVSYEAYQTYY